MGEKKKQSNGGEQKEGKKESGGGDNNNSITVVLKSDLHCEGCASKLIKSIRSVSGVETAMFADVRKIAVVGNVDPAELREKVEQKARQKVELILPPQLKSGGDSGKSNGDKKKNESKDKKSDEKSDEKKSKEPPATTVVLKVNLHCDGCVQKIHKTVSKTKGFKEMKIDKLKDLVTVTGAMNMKALAELLQKQLKKDVAIIPPKKEEQKKEKPAAAEEDKMEGNRMQAAQIFGYAPYPFMLGPGVGEQFGPGHYAPYPIGSFHAPQMFSDENPNACSVM